MIRKRTNDGVTEYSYDNADNLPAINFTDIRGDQQLLDYINHLYYGSGHLHQINRKRSINPTFKALS